MTDQPITFVNVLDVDPERQEELLDLLVRGALNVIRHRPGFLSLTLLAGTDRRRVINVARWACADDARATQNDSRAADCAARAAAIAKSTPGLYRVAADIR